MSKVISLSEEEKKEILNILEQDSSKVFFDSVSNFEGVGHNEYKKLVKSKKLRFYSHWPENEQELGGNQGYETHTLFEVYNYIKGVHEIKFAKEIIKHFIDNGYLVVIQYVDRYLDTTSYDITPVKQKYSDEKILRRKNQTDVYSELLDISKILNILKDRNEKKLENYVQIDKLIARKTELEEMDKIRTTESEKEWEITKELEQKYEDERMAEWAVEQEKNKSIREEEYVRMQEAEAEAEEEAEEEEEEAEEEEEEKAAMIIRIY